MNRKVFKGNAPGPAALGEVRFEPSGLVLPGTVRKNGWPRILLVTTNAVLVSQVSYPALETVFGVSSGSI